MKRITSRQNPLVARLKAVARGDEPGLFLDGTHLVAEALSSSVGIRHALVTSDGLMRDDIRGLVAQLEQSGADLASVPPSVMAAVSSVQSASAIVALADGPQPAGERLYASTPLVVIACDVQDPGNIGAIVRVTEAAGGTGLIAAGRCADPFGAKALRGSMGSALRLPIARAQAAAAIADARGHGCRVLAAVPRRGTPLFDLRLTGPLAVLIGGEGAGLAEPLVNAADGCFTIPMQAGVESLNAAVTAAVVLYEAYRQRHIERASASHDGEANRRASDHSARSA
jgi:TrmH family RNA methyltransferase